MLVPKVVWSRPGPLFARCFASRGGGRLGAMAGPEIKRTSMGLEVPVLPAPVIATPTQSGPRRNMLEVIEEMGAWDSKRMAMDGNKAAAHIAYAMSDLSCIYPISPSTSMGENMDAFAVAGRKNIFGQTVSVTQMQSELGSAGALHGAMSGGALATTFTCSQGLLLMIPNMYLLAGELMPAVFHVSARALARHSLSIFNDHSDVMAVRATGFGMICSSNAQAVMDLGLVTHLAAIKASVPFVHFFDGNRTSGAVCNVQAIDNESISKIYPWDALRAFRARALNPQHPIMRGTGQDSSTYMQTAVAANAFYDKVPSIVEESMKEVSTLTGRTYKLFEYHGDPEADRVVVIMGSAASTVALTVDHLCSKGEKVGVLQPRLFRPFSTQHFLDVLPESVTKVCVLDRTKEDFASALPLHQDVQIALAEGRRTPTVVGGYYGLGSKEFRPEHVIACFENLKKSSPKNKFCLGIVDDVGNSNLKIEREYKIDPVPDSTKQCLFWGLGSDGTVGANKDAIALIANNTKLHAQGYFSYSSQKAGGSTLSSLRFGPEPIKAEYEINQADYSACMNAKYLTRFHMMKYAKFGSTFVVNCPWHTIEDLENNLPAKLRKEIAKKQVTMYTIDAHAVAESVGLPPKRINQVMQAVFFHLSGVIPPEQARGLLNEAIEKTYGGKGETVVNQNKKALAQAVDKLHEIDYPESWATSKENKNSLKAQSPSTTPYSKMTDDFTHTISKGIIQKTADDLPTSAFLPGGDSPVSQTLFEKRGLALEVPEWIPANCTQCNKCAIVCPHAVIRPFLLDKDESKKAPKGFRAVKGKGEAVGLNYTIQIAPYDCTGCAVCVEACPDDALVMKKAEVATKQWNDHWEYAAYKTANKGHIADKLTMKGSQFQDPLLEFSGACSGCGETPYVKLLTQMFGDRMVVANSSGCSSVWGGSYGLSPWRTNDKGQGPAWARSLFEDTAEYGMGMALASKQRRGNLKQVLDDALAANKEGEEVASPELISLLTKLQKGWTNVETCQQLYPEVKDKLQENMHSYPNHHISALAGAQDMIVPPSHWIIGGDGWAYDIGFAGLDHVLASKLNINVLVLDTEVYSNTGAQRSKSTPSGAIAKFALGGKAEKKKDLGRMSMMHEGAYVASVSLSADMNQTVIAFREAEAYDGPSLIISYATCVDWGHRLGDKAMVTQQVQAVDTGYWPLYRFNPDNIEEGNPLQVDARRISDGKLGDMLKSENRFAQLMRKDPTMASAMEDQLHSFNNRRHKVLTRHSMHDEELLESLKKLMGEQVTGDRVTILYGSETGNAEGVAKTMKFEMQRRGMRARTMALDDVDIPDLADESSVFAVVATSGQGDMPPNSVKFWEDMQAFLKTEQANGLMAETKFGVFGLGDSSYVYFNKAAENVDSAFEQLGGKRIMNLGMGDDQHPARFHTELEDWVPDYFDAIEAPPPPQELGPPSFSVKVTASNDALELDGIEDLDSFEFKGSKEIKMNVADLLTPVDYDRNITHFQFDLKGTGLSYEIGDALGLWPHNRAEDVKEALDYFGLRGDDILSIEDLLKSRSEALSAPISAKKLFTEVLDLWGWPKRRFYEMLKLLATDEGEKTALAYICSKEGKDEYLAYIAETYTYLDLMKKFPSAQVSLGHLLDYVPDIKPRLYSIASGPTKHGDETVQLCVIMDDWKTPAGRDRRGLCTTWLAEQHPADMGGTISVRAKVNPSAVTFPEDHKPPFVMVALGTGIAPIRAYSEERREAMARGEECGELALFYGARHEKTEFCYADQFNKYKEEGLMPHIHGAWSRDQKEKIYVQNRLQQQSKLLFDMIHEKNGYVYLCGPGGSVPPAVRKAVIEAIRDVGGFSQEYAENYVTDMQMQERYLVEAW